jgi:bifunctional non-homologous end joining protein LigD
VRFFSRHGAEYTDRLPGMVEAFAKLSAKSAILDGELVLINPNGGAHFYRLMREMRTRTPDESQLMFLAFDILFQDGVDLRNLPLSQRKRDLNRLCLKARVPFLKQVEQFPDGDVLLDYCNRFEFEGVVSKCLASHNSSGPSRNWIKTKCPGWKRASMPSGQVV